VLDKKVRHTARVLGIEELLDRRPKDLSGGQRQRVAIGNAIIRNPKVLLMDEPLSNLDAKLRSQMRVELAKMHREMGNTIVYVTHDQTEAMTLGTKIIVMKDGVVQQADTPERIYRHPTNKFVAGFIGAPSMNFMETMVMERNGAVYLEGDGGVTLRARGENEMVLRRAYLGKMVILGLRPEDLQDETTASAHRICYEENQLKAFVDLREMIGAEAYLHMNTGKNLITARVPSEVPVTVKESITLYADMEKAQIFDPFTEENILSLPVEKEERATA
jgi:multiple sugar transport system ATP-binding protein